MKNVAASFLAVVALASSVAAQFTLNTPTAPVQCVATQFTWSGGSAPYTLLISEPDANGPPVQQYGGLSGTSFTWSTNITAGTFIGATLRDSTGASAQTAAFQINPGSDNSCLTGGAAPPPPPTSGSSAPSSGSSGAPGSTVSTPSVSAPSNNSPSSPPASNTPPPTSHTSSPTSGSHTSSGSSSPSPSNTGAASANVAVAGAAGVIGAIVAAIMA